MLGTVSLKQFKKPDIEPIESEKLPNILLGQAVNCLHCYTNIDTIYSFLNFRVNPQTKQAYR